MKWHAISKDHLNLFRPQDIVEKNKEKGYDHKNVGIRSLDWKYIHRDTSGNFYIVAEENYSNMEMYYTELTKFYYYRNIFVIKLSQDLEKKWIRVIPKHQKFTDPENKFSFTSFGLNKGLFFLYMDHPENLEVSPDQEPTSIMRKTAWTMHGALVTPEGTVRKIPVMDPSERGLDVPRFPFARMEKVSPNSIVMEMRKGGGKEVLLELTLK